jgi:hypothetical protein
VAVRASVRRRASRSVSRRTAEVRASVASVRRARNDDLRARLGVRHILWGPPSPPAAPAILMFPTHRRPGRAVGSCSPPTGDRCSRSVGGADLFGTTDVDHTARTGTDTAINFSRSRLLLAGLSMPSRVELGPEDGQLCPACVRYWTPGRPILTVERERPAHRHGRQADHLTDGARRAGGRARRLSPAIPISMRANACYRAARPRVYRSISTRHSPGLLAGTARTCRI